MTMTDTWAEIGPASVTGFGSAGAAPGTGPLRTGVEQAVATQESATPPLWSPDNPLFWFAVILAGTAGLFAVSVSVKAGPAKASAAL